VESKQTLPGNSPVNISQTELISLNGLAKTISLDVFNVKSFQTGAYISLFRGRGMEFDESRPYQPGDDPRSIDWRVTARSSFAYTKLFREERERPVFVVTDFRSSMDFATRGCFKSVNAAKAAALIAWSAHHRGDRLGGLIFGDKLHCELKPRLGRKSALRFIHNLIEIKNWRNESTHEASHSFTKAMAALRRVSRPGSLVVIISDFNGFSRASQSHLSNVARHNDVFIIFMHDPIEKILPPPGHYRIVAPSEELEINTSSKAARRNYENKFINKEQNLKKFCRRYGIHLMSISTDDNPVTALQSALGKRSNKL
tara:strand:- start:2531 stop:3472 length:942 start_codon:yes stop_codon:yes gene_type:complete